MREVRRAAEPLTRSSTALFAAAVAGAWLLLIAVFTFARLVLGHRVLPSGAVALTVFTCVTVLGAIVAWRWEPTRRSLDRILGRSIAVTVLLAIYLVAVLALFLLDGDVDLEAALLAAGMVALLARPVRSFAQRRVDSLLFGGHGNPYRVITELGQRLETTALPEAVLPGVVDTVARSLHLSYVAIELESATGCVVVASTGAIGGPVTRLPLVHQAEGIGWLVMGTPASGELTRADRRLLEHLARQIGVAARAVQLMHDLEQSRALVVIARDEERRRLQRNLHDGIGPMLAGINLSVQAARNLVRSDPAQAEDLLAGVVTDTRAATEDVRALVYDLRPPALDRVGLVAALREQASRLSATGNGDREPPAVVIEVPEDLSGLPPAVELTAFRIALEALVNVCRHANARHCSMRFTLNGALQIDMIDDGIGMAVGVRPGVGISSMQERAMELGGTCTVTSAAGGGTHVHARLPIPSISGSGSSRSVPAGTSPGSPGLRSHDGGTPHGPE